MRSVTKSTPRQYHKLIVFARVSLGVLHKPAVNHACIDEQLVKLLMQQPRKVKIEKMSMAHQSLV
jgi:hypothetical protein